MTVVIGVGNPYRGDDGAGPAVIDMLRWRAPTLTLVESDGEPSGLIDLWQDEALALVVDAVHTHLARPGTVHRIEAPEGEPAGVAAADPAGRIPAMAAAGGAGSHSLGLGDAYALGRALGRLPRRLIVYGIEGTCFSLGDPISLAVAAAVGRVAEAVLADVAGAS